MASNELTFKQETPFDKRVHLSNKILQSYHDRIPMIVEPYRASDPKNQRKKFLAPAELSMVRIIADIRKHIAVDSNTALYFYVAQRTDLKIQTGDSSDLWGTISNNIENLTKYIPHYRNMILIPGSYTMAMIYNQYRDEDGFLYVNYTTENAFGKDIE